MIKPLRGHKQFDPPWSMPLLDVVAAPTRKKKEKKSAAGARADRAGRSRIRPANESERPESVPTR